MASQMLPECLHTCAAAHLYFISRGTSNCTFFFFLFFNVQPFIIGLIVQEPYVWEGKSRCNPSNCLNVPVTSVTPRESYLLLMIFPNMVTVSKHFSDDEFVCLCYCCVCFVC